MKLQLLHQEPVFAADIDVSKIENHGITIMSIDEIVMLIHGHFASKRINVTLTRDVIRGGQAKPVYELVASEAVGMRTVLSEIRTALEEKNIDWYEPYAEESDTENYRFITPKVNIFR